MKSGSKRLGYNLVPVEEQLSWRNQRCVLCTRSQEQHIEHGSLAFWWDDRVGEKGDGARIPDYGV